MNSKIKVLVLLSFIVIATVATSLILVTQLTAKADTTTTPLASDVSSPQSTPQIDLNATDNGGAFCFNQDRGFGGPRGMDERGFGGPQGFGQIQMSSDFTANVTNIAQNDTDVQNLISQGYNITSIRPVITTSIDGNGNIVTKATTADVTMQSTSGRALVVVDLSQDKVTKIDTVTWTEINK